MDKPPLRILIADDNEMVRKIVRKLVEAESGWVVCGEAVDGADTVAKSVDLKPDVLLLDISMPQLGGWEACESISKLVPHTKILFITEHDPSLIQAAAAQAPVHGFVAKSEIVTHLKAAVAAAMNCDSRV